MKIKSIIIILLFCYSCNSKPDPNYLGYVHILPKGEYTIKQGGSRHIVRCTTKEGKYYLLNDSYFEENGIEGRDAHEYPNPTEITIE